MGMLNDKVAFVTGAASGIGESTALRFAGEGAKLVIADVKEDELRRVGHAIKQAGGEALAVTCDVSDADSVKNALAEAAAKWSRLDVVYANAGVGGVWAPIEDLQPEEWDRTIGINLRGAFLTLHFAIPHLKQSGGSIIFTSSVSGNRTFAQSGAAAYSTSKGAEVALMKMAAIELARYGIRVNAVCPGAIPTNIGQSLQSRNTEKVSLPELPHGDQNPALHGGVGEPRDVADVCLFLASDLSRHVTGVEIYVDGGESLLR
ncbi:MAG TPA: SDR family NAD(P)-dependent oxidoreductase [Tepidisphaeraceae bacterium]|jgi:NAD(P)-dependent dehydrogenase (short-subunit alcohol dehydrogenase family)